MTDQNPIAHTDPPERLEPSGDPGLATAPRPRAPIESTPAPAHHETSAIAAEPPAGAHAAPRRTLPRLGTATTPDNPERITATTHLDSPEHVTVTTRPESPEGVAAAWQRELPGAPTRALAATWLVKAVAGRLRRARERALAEAGVDAATLDLLSTLRRAGEPYALTTRELAERCLVSAGAISQRVARAEADGLVVRRPLARRRVEVALTPAGHEVVERTARLVLQADDGLSTSLTDAELQHLEHALARWLDTLTRTEPD